MLCCAHSRAISGAAVSFPHAFSCAISRACSRGFLLLWIRGFRVLGISRAPFQNKVDCCIKRVLFFVVVVVMTVRGAGLKPKP